MFMKNCCSRRTGGAIVMCIGILILGAVLLPASCLPFIIGLALVLKGYSMLKKSGYRL
jgi:hypothetical protein